MGDKLVKSENLCCQFCCILQTIYLTLRVPNVTVGPNKSVGANFSWKLIKKRVPNKSVGGKFS